jgi:hypothetical protein
MLRCLTLIVLYKVFGYFWHRSIFVNDCVVHESLSPEQSKTPGTTEYTANNVLCSLLHPMADSIFKLLVPYNRTYINIITDKFV